MSLRQGFGKQACEICGNVFTKRDHLDRHVRIHTKEKPFSCARCAASFSRRCVEGPSYRFVGPDGLQETHCEGMHDLAAP
jgi:hypothetical protein